MFLNSIPVVGHVKGLIHYAAGDVDGGNKAMLDATRSTAVVAGGVVGAVGGPAGAALGAAAGGMVMDTVTSVVTDEPQGIYQNIDNIATDIQKGEIPVASTLGMGLTVGTDLLTGLGAGSIAGSATKSLGSSAGKSAAKSVAKSIGKGVSQEMLKKELKKQAIVVGATVGTAVVVLAHEANNGPCPRPPRGGGGSGGFSSSTSNNKTGGSRQSNNTSTGSSSGAGSQPPNPNPNKGKKGHTTKLTSILARLLEIFGVESLDDICIAGHYIFRGLNSGQKNFLKTRLQNLNRMDYNIEHVVRVVERLLKKICGDSSDINFKNFLCLIELVATYIGEQVDRLNDLYNDSNDNLNQIVVVSTFRTFSLSERLRTLAEVVSKNLLRPKTYVSILADVTIYSIVSIFNTIKSKIEGISCVPNFRNLYSAVYHYFKHRHVPEENCEVSVQEYFDMIITLLDTSAVRVQIGRLQQQEIPEVQIEGVSARYGKKIKLVLKLQNGSVHISSFFFID